MDVWRERRHLPARSRIVTSAEYRRLRESLGSQEHVAHLLGISSATIDRRENERWPIKTEAEYALLWLRQQERKKPSPKVRRLKRTPNGRPAPSTRKRKAEKRAAEFARCYGSEERVAWVKTLRCAVPGCASGRIDNAHAVSGGAARKADARHVLPLCFLHHRELHQLGARTFEKKYEISLALAAEETEARWQESQR